MQDKIMETFNKYVKENKIDADNYNAVLKVVSYTSFFNEITVDNLGEPNFTHDKCSNTKGALVYIPEVVKDKLVPHITMLTINSFYYGALSKLEFNYKDYVQFMEALVKTRKEIKLNMYNAGKIDEEINIIQLLIKSYLNLIYGMIDNNRSVLTSSHEKPREFVVEMTKNTILTISAFLINRGVPIYYIDTDEIHCGRISIELYSELQEFYSKECSQFIDTNKSELVNDTEGFTTAYYIGKKRLMLGDKTRTEGIDEVEDSETLKENKLYFGMNFPTIFPEYAI